MSTALVSNNYPGYVEPSKGGAVRNNKAEGAHELLDKGDPKVNGPYLDDVRAMEEETYRKNRAALLKKKSESDVTPEHRAESPGGERVRMRVPKGTKKHPRSRPLSNPSDINPEDNLEVPTLEQVREDMHVAATKKKAKPAAKKTAKKPAKKASASKKVAAAKKTPAKKTVSKKK